MPSGPILFLSVAITSFWKERMGEERMGERTKDEGGERAFLR